MYISGKQLLSWLNKKTKEEEERCDMPTNRSRTFQEVVGIVEKVEVREQLRKDLNTQIMMRSSIWKDLEKDLDVDEDHYWRAEQHTKLAMIEEEIADLEIKVKELNRDLEKADWEEV